MSYDEMAAFTRAALGVVPITKLLYSSDGVGAPEVHWLSAICARRVLGEALGECVARNELSAGEAQTAGVAVLNANAVRPYRL